MPGDIITFSPASPGKRLRALLNSGQGAEGNTTFFVPNDFTLRSRPSNPSGFNPQNGIVTMNISVFLINVAGATPQISAAVRSCHLLIHSHARSCLLDVYRYIAMACLNPCHIQDFGAIWFNSENPSGANNTNTMENYFGSCSYGKTRMSNVRKACLLGL